MVTKQQKAETEFEEMIKELGETAPKMYSMDSNYTRGDFLEHKVFGIGKVVDLITPNKVIVRFRDGEKALICTLMPLG